MQLLISRALLGTALMLTAQPAVLTAGFRLTATVTPEEQILYLPIKIRCTLTNTGPDCRIPLGLHRLNCYLFVYVAHENQPEKLWIDTTVPQAGFAPSPATDFPSGTSLNGQFLIYWQPDRPMLHRPGRWRIRLVWKSPNGDVSSPAATVVVAAPSAAEFQVLRRIHKADALASLHLPFWKLEEHAERLPHWRALADELAQKGKECRYAQQLRQAVQQYDALRPPPPRRDPAAKHHHADRTSPSPRPGECQRAP